MPRAPSPRMSNEIPRPRRTSRKRSIVDNPFSIPTQPKFVQPLEKHQLIAAHAAMQAERRLDPVQRRSLWAGVLVTAVAVMVGWWWTTVPVYQSALLTSVSEPLLSPEFASQLESFQARLSEVSVAKEAIGSAVSRVAGAAMETVTSTERVQLFQEIPTSTSVTNTSRH